MRRIATAAVVLFAVAGCSSGGGTTTYQSPAAMASKLGTACTGYAATTPTYYAKAEGGCNNVQLELVTFASDSNRDEWVKVA